jgi:hypothetical protein
MDPVTSIQHLSLLLNAAHSQVLHSESSIGVWYSFEIVLNAFFCYLSRATSYRWKGILPTSTVSYYAVDYSENLLFVHLITLVATKYQDSTFLWAIWSILGKHQGIQCAETVARGGMVYQYLQPFSSLISTDYLMWCFLLHRFLQDTLSKAEEIFGTEHKDLYSSFQSMLNRNQSWTYHRLLFFLLLNKQLLFSLVCLFRLNDCTVLVG